MSFGDIKSGIIDSDNLTVGPSEITVVPVIFEENGWYTTEEVAHMLEIEHLYVVGCRVPEYEPQVPPRLRSVGLGEKNNSTSWHRGSWVNDWLEELADKYCGKGQNAD